MRISNVGVAGTPLTSQPTEISAASGEQTSAGATTETSTYSPSPELVKLVSLASQQPEVRPDVVQAAITRLQQGFYHTSSAAANTASAMLNSAD
jgi:hypothetical protein